MTTESVFSDLKVVDLASFIAGPGAATILSDFGADVIKVEPPGSGDPHRQTYRIPPQPRSNDNYAWQLDNRNKRGMAVDLKSPHAREILERHEQAEHQLSEKLTPGATAGVEPAPEQQALFTPLDREVLDALRDADLDNLKPIEALNLLEKLKKQIL